MSIIVYYTKEGETVMASVFYRCVTRDKCWSSDPDKSINTQS